jgi:hypothetical protein
MKGSSSTARKVGGAESPRRSPAAEGEDVLQLLLLHAGQADNLVALALPKPLQEMPEISEVEDIRIAFIRLN